MSYGKKWKPSRTAARKFAEKMNEIDNFCAENGISQSRLNDSYYFTLNGIKYRVSNHSIEASNADAYNWQGEQVRGKYHDDSRRDDTIYIHAGKTRIIEIYENLKKGKMLDGRGNVKEV